jgi:hypothetical protein
MTFNLDRERVRIIDRLDSRVLGALRPADVTTGVWVTGPLKVTAPGAAFTRNRSGVYVLTFARELETHLTEFSAPPTMPAVGSIVLTVKVEDPSGQYLPRSVRLAVPRDPDPAHANDEGSLFLPVRVLLYPAPAASLCPGWAVVRASVTQVGSNAAVPYAWLRLRRATQAPSDPPMATGMTDARGEALVAVSGIPVTNWDVDDGPLLATEVDAVIDAYYDANAGFPPDPDAIDAKRDTLLNASQALKVASGRQSIVRLELSLS